MIDETRAKLMVQQNHSCLICKWPLISHNNLKLWSNESDNLTNLIIDNSNDNSYTSSMEIPDFLDNSVLLDNNATLNNESKGKVISLIQKYQRSTWFFNTNIEYIIPIILGKGNPITYNILENMENKVTLHTNCHNRWLRTAVYRKLLVKDFESTWKLISKL